MDNGDGPIRRPRIGASTVVARARILCSHSPHRLKPGRLAATLAIQWLRGAAFGGMTAARLAILRAAVTSAWATAPQEVPRNCACVWRLALSPWPQTEQVRLVVRGATATSRPPARPRRLVGEVQPQVRNRPGVQRLSQAFSARSPLTHALEVFSGDPARGVFRLCYQAFAHTVVGVFDEACFLAAARLQEALGALGSLRLTLGASDAGRV
jgi:hypothetical protein